MNLLSKPSPEKDFLSMPSPKSINLIKLYRFVYVKFILLFFWLDTTSVTCV